ncbi:energy transducer TonB [Aurantiacibacter flavus]|uniref:Energy transducer TonB n=1 Tax=Aurantiacibacter flavus TaxID=3145232 RepID=A0ABV0CY04_9SPHN
MIGSEPRPAKRLNWKLIAVLTVAHVLALIGLAQLFAPNFTAAVVQRATSLVTVTVSTYEEPEPTPPPEVATPEPDAGAAGEEGERATPREVVAPSAPLPRPDPAPRAASTGNADSSGARDQGAGTGAGGEGEGTGAGGSGRGQGGGVVTGPSYKSGAINSARDFPVPEGGRNVRDGTSVTVAFTVGVDGRASNCSVVAPGPDPATNALVCSLVIERIRFNPATDANGNPVPARYGWRQDFFRR